MPFQYSSARATTIRLSVINVASDIIIIFSYIIYLTVHTLGSGVVFLNMYVRLKLDYFQQQ